VDQQALAEYRYRAVREVLEGSPIGEVAHRYGTSRQLLDAWRKRFLAEGLPGPDGPVTAAEVQSAPDTGGAGSADLPDAVGASAVGCPPGRL